MAFQRLFRLNWIFFRIAIVVPASLVSLSYTGAEGSVFSANNSQVVREKLLSNQEFNSLEKNDIQVILTKSDGGPIISPKTGPPFGLTPFPAPPPTGPGRGAGLNPFRSRPLAVPSVGRGWYHGVGEIDTTVFDALQAKPKHIQKLKDEKLDNLKINSYILLKCRD